MNNLENSKAMLQQYTCVLWDMDDTIYDERTFLFQAYEKFSLNFHNQEKPIFQFLVDTFKSNGRKNLLDKLVSKFDLQKTDDVIRKLFLNALRCEIYPLEPNKNFLKLSKSLDKLGVTQGVITNGTVQQQANKVESLKLRKHLPGLEVVYADNGEKKPATWSYLEMAKKIGIKSYDKVVYIGDSEVDLEFARNSSIDFLFVQDVL